MKEYDAANYDTQMIADLAAGSAPDIYVQKNLKNFYTYQNGKQLLDVSDVAATARHLATTAPQAAGLIHSGICMIPPDFSLFWGKRQLR